VCGGGVIDAARDRGQCALVQNDIDIFDGRLGDLRIAHIGLDKINFVYDRGKVAFFACEQIVNNSYKAALRDELFADIRTDKTGSAGYQKFLHKISLSQKAHIQV